VVVQVIVAEDTGISIPLINQLGERSAIVNGAVLHTRENMDKISLEEMLHVW